MHYPIDSPIEEPLPHGNDGNFLADMHDDDGQVLDSLVSSHAEPPKGDDLPIVRLAMRPVAETSIPPIQRLGGRTINITGKTPYLLLNADPWRKWVHIDTDTNNAAAYPLQFASSRTDCQNLLTASSFVLTNTDDLKWAYNGELWVYYDGPAAGMRVSVMTISSMEAGR